MASLIHLALLTAALTTGLAREDRIDGEMAVERARYAFVIGATGRFEDTYPRSVFEARVDGEMEREETLATAFGVRITPALLAREYERIERDTRAPDQWTAVKAALGNERRRIEEVVCRPLVVDRLLREHQQATKK
jgi:hypothetical protein